MGLPSVCSLFLCLILPADAILSDSEKWKHVETFFTQIKQQQSELKKVNTQLSETIENQIHVIKKLENRIAILESADCECRKLDKAKQNVVTADSDSKVQKNYEETYVSVKNNRTDDVSVKQSPKGITVPILQPQRRISGSQTIGNIAFDAYMPSNEQLPALNHILVFRSVQTNVGGHYNKFSGMFTVPENGIYVFTWTVVCDIHAQRITQIVVNAAVVGAAMCDAQGGSYFRTTTGLVVVEVNQGEVVFIRTHPTHLGGKAIISAPDFHRTTFSGWKL
ncbi:uncharacterized protein LOC134710561 [Mytilus trossulus]|uniref:uncharacterized protein LOC134710561 n=1 Tax=Mytilus trossulus TaxID=6551 RepID=UPI003006C372